MSDDPIFALDENTLKTKIALASALHELMCATGDMFGDVYIPAYPGLGTDGTCWSKSEHAAYLLAVCKACCKAAETTKARA